jgi:hypothetical protein
LNSGIVRFCSPLHHPPTHRTIHAHILYGTQKLKTLEDLLLCGGEKERESESEKKNYDRAQKVKGKQIPTKF